MYGVRTYIAYFPMGRVIGLKMWRGGGEMRGAMASGLILERA